MTRQLQQLLTRRDAIGETLIDTTPLPEAARPGEAILAIDRFAITANNMTYAAYGDSMKYWDFFPTGIDGWAMTPAWGFADVTASGVDGLSAGDRVYGFLPMASHLCVRPGHVTARGFTDDAPHRGSLPVLYNQYIRTSADATHHADRENLICIVRPLFTTSFVLADFLAANDYFGATRVIISSASSKTAYGTAYCLAEMGQLELVGLTSQRNVAFVEGLGCYGRACAYDHVESLDPATATVYVDFSGDVELRRRIHEHLRDQLRHNALIGSTLGVRFERDTSLPGPRPTFFFAPTQIKRRREEWGMERFLEKLNAIQDKFMTRASSGASPWIRVTTHQGLAAAATIVAELVAGKAAADAGHVVLLR